MSETVFMDLNFDCLLIIINYLCLADQANLARCCKGLNSLCLRERTFKTKLHKYMYQFDLQRIYINLGSWRRTARYWTEVVYPLEMFNWKIMPRYIDRYINSYNNLRLMGVDDDDAYIEAKAMIDCYKQLYPYLLNTHIPPKSLMLNAWHSSEKSELWNWEVSSVHNYPLSCRNLGFLTRLTFQSYIDKHVAEMIDELLDELKQPRSLPSVRNLIFTILPMNM